MSRTGPPEALIRKTANFDPGGTITWAMASDAAEGVGGD